MNARQMRDTAIGLAPLGLMALLWVRFLQSGLSRGGPDGKPERAGAIAVFFTRPPSAGTPVEPPAPGALLQAIGQSDETIDVAAYDLQLPSIGEALSQAWRRGVRIRVAMESGNLHEAVVQRLEGEGIVPRGDRRDPLMHHKFMIIDGREVWTGSMNFTYNGVYRNDNALICITPTGLPRILSEGLKRCSWRIGLGRYHWLIHPIRTCWLTRRPSR
jgi:phosphatidylserine/phosphatidylglycerophosphate/cardiolipin synthase-like enzyme